jgi:hypothetical protein
VAVPAVFISSVQVGFESERQRAQGAVLAIRMHPVMAESTAASPSSPRRALLDEVAEADYFLLILGPRYGDRVASGNSPTEDELLEAKRLGKPIIVLVQQGQREPAQEEFLARLRSGGWEGAVLYGSFSGPEDIANATAGAFAKLKDSAGSEDLSGAQARAGELVGSDSRQGTFASGFGSGVAARIAIVPTVSTLLLDALALEDDALPDDLAGFARQAGLAPQSIGLGADVSAQGIALQGSTAIEDVQLLLRIGVGGEVIAQSSVRAAGDLMGFARSIIDPERLSRFVEVAGAFALAAWKRIDTRSEIRRSVVQLAIPDAEYKGYGITPTNSMSLSGHLPALIRAPEPALVINRDELASAQAAKRLVAHVRRVFTDAGRVYT